MRSNDRVNLHEGTSFLSLRYFALRINLALAIIIDRLSLGSFKHFSYAISVQSTHRIFVRQQVRCFENGC